MSTEAKFLPLRILLDEMNNIKNGWFFHMASLNKTQIREDHNIETLSEYRMKINWVESLGDVNYTRIGNIKLGAHLVDHTRLKPGQIFSLRRALGNATIKRGFGEGPVIKHGITTTTVGGGLCLVSSILFNVALLANLKILEKYSHGTDLWGEDRFVGLGLDATYAYGILDLKFRNNLSQDLVLLMGVNEEERYLWCKILGHVKDKYKVTIDSQVIEELKMENDSKPYQTGWKVRTIRYIEDNKKNISYDKIETYHPFYKA